MKLFDDGHFDEAGAVLLMSTGSYERTRDLLKHNAELAASVERAGRIFLENGTKPDMQMLVRLGRILLQARKMDHDRSEN